MRIAVLLYGHLRDFENCADSLYENLLRHQECDVFIHTWDEKDHNSKCWHEQRVEASKVDEQVVDLIKSKYNPKGLVIEHQEKYAQEKMLHLAYLPGIEMSSAIPHFMFYSMNKANQLRKEYEKAEGVSYDYVFVTRPDIRLKKIFDLNYYLNEIVVLGLDMKACRFYGPFEKMSIGGVSISRSNDLLFFAKPSVIDKYIEINQVVTDEDVQKYGLTILSIFTAKEILNGIIPIPLTYSMSADWDYSSVRQLPAQQSQHRPYKAWKKMIYKIGATLLYPISRLQKKYRLFNYYEYKKEFS